MRNYILIVLLFTSKAIISIYRQLLRIIVVDTEDNEKKTLPGYSEKNNFNKFKFLVVFMIIATCLVPEILNSHLNIIYHSLILSFLDHLEPNNSLCHWRCADLLSLVNFKGRIRCSFAFCNWFDDRSLLEPHDMIWGHSRQQGLKVITEMKIPQIN